MSNIIDQTSYRELYDFSSVFKREKLSKVYDPKAKNLISQLLCKDPINRLTIKQVIMHPFLSFKKTSKIMVSNCFIL